MKRLTRINCSDIHELMRLCYHFVLFVIVLANVSLVTLAKADTSVEQTNHPGIEIVSPLSGSTHEPGTLFFFKVNIDPAFNATEVYVLPSTPGALTGPLIANGPPFAGTMTITNEFTGPLEFEVMARDSAGIEIGSSYVAINVVSSEVPASLFTGNDVEFMTPGVGETEQVRPVAVYANGTHRHVYTQSRFSSSNPTVATVTASGLVTAVNKGIAFISAEFMGKTAYAEIHVRDPVLRDDITVENTPKVSIEMGEIRVDLATARFVQQVTVTNISALPLSQPLWLVISDLPSGVVLTNRVGVTKNLGVLGSPLVSLDVRDANQQSFLVPGSSTSTVLEFWNPNSAPIDYTTRVFSARKP